MGRKVIDYVRRLRPHQWAWLHFKFALGIGWSTAILFVTPTQIQQVTSEGGLRVWAYGTLAGAIVSLVGMFINLADSEKRARFGIRLELTGLILFAGGPLQYLIVQVTLLTQSDEAFSQRYALTWFAYAMLAAVIVRLVIVFTAMRRGVRPDRTRNNL